MSIETASPSALEVASLMITCEHFDRCQLFRNRRFTSQTHGTILTLRHLMSVSLMCCHVNFQVRFGVESIVTDMTSFVSDVQVNRVLVVCQMIVRLRSERASRVVARKRPLVAVHVSLVFGDIFTPRGSKRASRIITADRSGSSVKPIQMLLQTSLPR